MEKEELTKALDERDNALKNEMDEKIKSIPQPADNSEELKNLHEAQEAMQKSIDGLNETNAKLSEQLGKISAKQLNEIDRKLTYKQAIKEAILEKQKEIKEFNQTAQMQLTKDAGPVTTSNIDGWVANAAMDPGVTGPQRRMPFLRQIINVFGINKGIAVWMEREEGDGDAAATAEGSTKSQVDQYWVEQSSKVEKITAYTKVSEEMLDDIDFAADDIANDLVERVMLMEDAQILAGDGNTPNLVGILSYAPEFTVDSDTNNTEFYHAIGNATAMDVLRVAVAMIAKANFVPTHIVVNPSDAALIALLKSSTGNYVNKSVNDLIQNITIIENNGMEAGTFLVGDMSKSNYRVRRDITVIVGRDADDLTKNLFTFIAEVRGVHYIKSNHVNAFVKGTFYDAIDAINGEGATQNVAVVSPLNEDGDAIMMESKQ